MSRLRVGIVGVGRHGSRYARHTARDVEGLELVAVCRRDRDQGTALAGELGCEYTADAYELIGRDDIDAVVLVTVPDLLEDFAVAAARAGKRLLVEKPVALDLASGRRILSAIEEAGVYCMAGHTLRFNAVCRRLRQEVGSLGRIDSLVLSQRFPPQLHLGWLDRPERSGGGNILHTGVHCFDLIRFLVGLQAHSVSCTTHSIYTERTEDGFAAHLRFTDSAALGMVTCSRSSGGRNGLIEISGENGQLVADHVLNTLYRVSAEGREEVPLTEPKMTVPEALEQFAADAREGTEPLVSYRDGLAAVAVADACYRSAKSGRHERVLTLDPPG